MVQAVDPGACTATPPTDDGGGASDSGGGDASGAAVDASGPPVDDGTCGNSAFGSTIYGKSGSDDDCKYEVTWSSTPLCEGGDGVYFTVNAKHKIDKTPLTGANPQPEVVFGDCMHTILNHPSPSQELSPGTYLIGPIVFNLSGRWEIRFHFYETCNDVPSSPHAHAAFWLDIP